MILHVIIFVISVHGNFIKYGRKPLAFKHGDECHQLAEW
jgi:hypothetical protein